MKKIFNVTLTICALLFLLLSCDSATPGPTAEDELIAALNKGGTVTLDKDVEVSAPLVIKNEVVLDLNGHKIYNTKNIWNTEKREWSLISVGEGGNLTIKGDGELLAKDCYAVDIRDNGKAVLEGGKYTGNAHAVYVRLGELEIKGGVYTLAKLNDNFYKFLINCRDQDYQAGNAKMVISGGSFQGYDPAAAFNESAEGNSFLAEGYKSTKRTVDGEVSWFDVTKVENK